MEGRVAWEYFESADNAKKYAFKCHRKTVDGVEQIFPVNATAFHPEYGTFATGGADGVVSVRAHTVCVVPEGKRVETRLFTKNTRF